MGVPAAMKSCTAKKLFQKFKFFSLLSRLASTNGEREGWIFCWR